MSWVLVRLSLSSCTCVAEFSLVDEILSRTDHEAIKKIYNLPQVGSTVEFLTMLALVSGRLLKVHTNSVRKVLINIPIIGRRTRRP